MDVKRIIVSYSNDFGIDYDTVDCENPHRVVEIWLKIKEISDFIEPEPCSISDLLLCHSQRIVSMVENHEETFSVARRAAGGAVAAARAALSGNPSFALIRPPGHHAGHDFNGGFCFFNNMAIALKKLLAEGLIRNALIVDIDLHYGNGTFDVVKDDERFSFKNIFAPTRERFFEAFEEALGDAASYDVVGCSAGFDTYILDWGAMLLTDDYRKIGNLLASSNRHVFSILEGGYYIEDLGLNVLSYLKGIQEACL
jgi:acetoin utilization deacetylase AcuC-like enzyme